MPYYQDSVFFSSWDFRADPRHINIISGLSNGPMVDLSEKFTFADIGCGEGISSCLLALLFPHARFFCFDINRKAIETAEKFASTLGLNNIKFESTSIEALDTAKYPKFNFIIAFGLLSWIDEFERDILLKKVSDHLSKDGIFYFSANMQSGLSEIAPIRELYRIAYEKKSSFEIINQLLSNIIEEQTHFFTPQARQYLTRFYDIKSKRMSEDFLKHEFCNSSWSLFTPTNLHKLTKDFELHLYGPFLSLQGAKLNLSSPDFVESAIFWEDVYSFRTKSTFRYFLCHKKNAESIRFIKKNAYMGILHPRILEKNNNPKLPIVIEDKLISAEDRIISGYLLKYLDGGNYIYANSRSNKVDEMAKTYEPWEVDLEVNRLISTAMPNKNLPIVDLKNKALISIKKDIKDQVLAGVEKPSQLKNYPASSLESKIDQPSAILSKFKLVRS